MKKLLLAMLLLSLFFASCGGGSQPSQSKSGNYAKPNATQSSNANSATNPAPNQPIFCGNCNGLGTTSIGLQCPVCGGSGYLYNPMNPSGVTNTYNNGGGSDNRYVKCARCNGTGRCFMCDGTGWFVYDGGYGTSGGVKRCEYCDGHGNCPTCHGTGKVLR